MKRLIWLIQVGLLLSGILWKETTDGWQMTFSDEFDRAALDRARWTTYPRWGRVDWKGEELQYYADDAFELRNGVLRIEAEERQMEGKDYTSGLIETRFSFEQAYGYFEIRAKVPKGRGLWPAFWMLPQNDWPPEIDVFEYIGHKATTLYMSNHWDGKDGEHESYTEAYYGPDFSADFHVYAVLWTPEEITWYVDGIERHRTNDGVPQVPMYVIANLAVGGAWPGDPDENTVFPSYLEIDYIRVYRWNGPGDPVPPAPPARPEPPQPPPSDVGLSVSFLPGVFFSGSGNPYPYP